VDDRFHAGWAGKARNVMEGHRTRVKICGTTNLEDALAAVEYGADALGFIRVPDSPRYVGDNGYHDVVSKDRLFVQSVVVVTRPSDANDLYSNYVQFYEEEVGRQDWFYESWRYIRAFRVKDESSLDEILSYRYLKDVGAILLDAYHPDKLGGSGETFNWDLARQAQERFQKPIILAGGLTPDNVGDAIRAVRPYAVDVSSGVEASPGKKDHNKLRAFLQAVREADAS
jgi:phosphoribosylanthranilate isomerase